MLYSSKKNLWFACIGNSFLLQHPANWVIYLQGNLFTRTDTYYPENELDSSVHYHVGRIFVIWVYR
jgi:hypothetical protein